MLQAPGQRQQAVAAKAEEQVQRQHHDGGDDDHHDDHDGVVDDLLLAGPHDLLHLARSVAEEFADALEPVLDLREEAGFLAASLSHDTPPFLLGLAMDSMLSAETAILLHLEAVGAVLLVLLGVVVALFALSTRKGNFNSHFRHLLFFCPSGL